MDVEFRALPAGTTTLRDIRKLYGLTQVEVARLLGYTQANVSKLDNKLIALAHLLAITESARHHVNILITTGPLTTKTPPSPK
jgi:transcriptional regulator with XRE-family HTH domain